MKLELHAIQQSPLHLANRQGAGNHSTTLDYLPGTAVRGALAMAYLNYPRLQKRVEQQLQPLGWTFQNYFNWLFLSGQVRFPNLYPHQRSLSLVVPLSARSCKRFTGFRDDDQLSETHGVKDVLLGEPDDFRCPAQPKRKPVCDAQMELPNRLQFYESTDGRIDGARRVKVERRLLTRTAMENATETVRPAMLYSLEALEEGGGGCPIFSGVLQADAPPELSPERQADLLQLLRAELGREELTNLQLGAARTRGLGTVKLEPLDHETFALPSLEDRFDQLQQVWRQTQSSSATPNVFTLTLNADAIVLDELWRYRSRLDEETLAREAPGAPPVELRRCFTRTRIVSGWNSAHRLPKEDELAIVKGAAFLYTTTADREILLVWLRQIEEQGIGERRSEGFGQVIACHPFHREVPRR